MTEHTVIEVLLDKEIEKLPEKRQRLCKALLLAIRHVQAPKLREPLPAKIVSAIESWYGDHENSLVRSPAYVLVMVDHFAALGENEVKRFCRALKLKVPRTGKFLKVLSTERSSDTTAFTVAAKILGIKESTVKSKASRARRSKG